MNSQTSDCEISTLELPNIQATYSTLSLNHERPGREWSLSFLKLPEYTVTFSGAMPTREEMEEVLSHLPWMPIVMVDICMSVAASALRDEHEEP